MVPLWQKKSVWQVTTIIQPALCHLVTSHFQEIACNWTPKDQIRWPIFLMLLCMIVLTEKTSKFPQPIIFWILVFSCHKMTLITKITWMPQHQLQRLHLREQLQSSWRRVRRGAERPEWECVVGQADWYKIQGHHHDKDRKPSLPRLYYFLTYRWQNTFSWCNRITKQTFYKIFEQNILFKN